MRKKYSALFLDRDGVVNQRLPNAYVADPASFKWMPGNPEAIVKLGHLFQRLLIVTNQQGVGKGRMSQQQLDDVHDFMLQGLAGMGGKVDGIYSCTDLKTQPGNCRKPSPEMGLKAKAAFPDIDFGRSLMVGDSLSDLQFAQNLGMPCAWLKGKNEEATAIKTAVQRGLPVAYEVESLQELYSILLEA